MKGKTDQKEAVSHFLSRVRTLNCYDLKCLQCNDIKNRLNIRLRVLVTGIGQGINVLQK